MVVIHEIASKKILPLVRGILVHRLRERGFSQHKIAQILSVTQPQVNKYLSKPLDYYYERITSLGFSRENVDYSISLMVSSIVSGYVDRYIVLINSILHGLATEYLCRARGELCVGGRMADPNIEYYYEWLSRIVKIDGLAMIMPEVGSNIVYAPARPKDFSDIIGLTGRIIRVGAEVRVVGEPMYGGSRHLAGTLLIATKYNESVRVAMNTAKISCIDKLKNKYNVAYSGPHASASEFWRNVEERLAEKPDILVDLGGYGLEPITYIYVDRFEKLELAIREIIRVVSTESC